MKTKYKIGDRVWALQWNAIRPALIKVIEIRVDGAAYVLDFYCDDESTVTKMEFLCHKTPEACAKQALEHAKIEYQSEINVSKGGVTRV